MKRCPPTRSTHQRCCEMAKMARLAYTAATRLNSSGPIALSPMSGAAANAVMPACTNSVNHKMKIVA